MNLTKELQGWVWARHGNYANPEPPGYERSNAPAEAADMLEMQEREIASLKAAKKIYILYSYEGYVIGLYSTLANAEAVKKKDDYIAACWLDDFA